MINLKNASINCFPFPHSIIKNSLEEKNLNNLINEFPNSEDVKRYENVMGGRRRLSSDSPLFYNFINKNPSWKAFYQSVNSKEFVNEIFSLYKDELKKTGCIIDNFTFDANFLFHKSQGKSDAIKASIQNKGWYSYLLRVLFKTGLNRALKNIFYYIPLRLTQRFKKNRIHVHFDISYANDGYGVETHHDSESRVAVFLIFFSSREEIGGTGGDFCIYAENPSLGKKNAMYPSKKDVKLNLTVPPTKNLMFSFLSTPNSYHSVPRMKNTKGPLKFIYVGISANKTNLWQKK